jgi:hypothetical protein
MKYTTASAAATGEDIVQNPGNKLVPLLLGGLTGYENLPRYHKAKK